MSDQRRSAAASRVSAFIVTAIATVAAVAAVGLAAGCAGSDQPPSASVSDKADAKKEPKASAKAGSNDRKSPGPAKTPGAGKQPPSSGPVDAKLGKEATAFVLSFMSAMDKAQPTGDFSKVKPMIGPTCRFCLNVIDWTGKIYKRGEKLVGGAYADRKPVVKGGSGNSVIVQVEATVQAYKIVNEAGKTTKSGKATRTVSTFTVSKGSGAWKVVSWAQR